MIDLHCHVLPGLDDGPASLDDARRMCEMAAADGCSALVATPHLRHPAFPGVDRDRCEEALRLLAATVTSPTLHLGAEVRVDDELLTEVEREGGRLLRLAGSRYLLVELPPTAPSVAPLDVVHELAVAGLVPVLAHPELLRYLMVDLDAVAELVEGGARLQITAMAVTGEFGRTAERAAWDLLRSGLVHFVASDAHSPEWRPPGLAAASAAISERLEPALATRLTRDNPARVLADEPVPA